MIAAIAAIAAAMTAMPHGLRGGLDLWHLALFPAALFYPGLLAWFCGVWVVRYELHPPVGWVLLAAAVVTLIAAGPLMTVLVACPVSMCLTLGLLGARVQRWRMSHGV